MIKSDNLLCIDSDCIYYNEEEEEEKYLDKHVEIESGIILDVEIVNFVFTGADFVECDIKKKKPIRLAYTRTPIFWIALNSYSLWCMWFILSNLLFAYILFSILQSFLLERVRSNSLTGQWTIMTWSHQRTSSHTHTHTRFY